MNLPSLRYAISDREAAGSDGRARLLEQAARLSAAGVDFLQLREKSLPVGELVEIARDLLAALTGSTIRLLINGRADVAVAVRAHGVHLTASAQELTAAQVYRLYAGAGLPAPLVTVSCHSINAVLRQRASAKLLSAILFGPVFEKSVEGTRVLEGSGLALLREACAAAAPIPVLALGGVTDANVAMCLAAGAGGVAGIRLFR